MKDNIQDSFHRFCAGDREAFGEIYQQLKKPVYTICWRILQSREAAEDVTHDVFVKLYLAPPDQSVKNLRAWIFQVAHNLAIDCLRKQQRPLPREETEAPDGFDRVDTRLDLERAMGKLSREEREILTLRLNGGLSFEAVAGILEISLPAAYRRYRKALKKLQELLNGGNL